MHVNYPGFSFSVRLLLLLWSRACPFTEHTCVGTKTKMAAGWCVCFVCLCVCFSTWVGICTYLYMYKVFFPHFFPTTLNCVCLVRYLRVCVYLLYIFCQYACFEHNESIKVFFLPIMSKKQQQKVGLCKKSSSTDAKAKQGKRGICEEKKKENQNNSGIPRWVTQSSSRFPAGSRDHPSFMICSRARSLCTFTALVEIRCCGPSSCDGERAENGGGGIKESWFSEAAANMLRVAGSWWLHRLTGTANSMRNRWGRGKKGCQSKAEISGLNVGWDLCFNHMEQTLTPWQH